MVVKGNCVLGGIKTSEFEGKQYYKAQLLDNGDVLMAKLDAKLKDELAKLPGYSVISCELHVYDYNNRATAQLISAVPAKQ